MKFRDLSNDPLIIEWLDTLNPSDNTKKIYLQSVQDYTGWVNKSPDALYPKPKMRLKQGFL